MKKGKNIITPPNLKDVTIGGETETLMNRFFYERIFSDDAKKIIYKEAEDAFRTRVDGDGVAGIWQGEFWGKLMISACEVYKYTQDDKLLAFIHRGAKEIMALQRDDGYIGTYKNSVDFMSPDPDVTEKIMGWRCTWNWNIWCRKYTLWGLLECYEVTNDTEILTAAQRHASQLIEELEITGTNIADTGTFSGMPSCSILKPMLILYKHTGIQRFFDFSQKIADNWERSDGKMPNLITNALSGKRITKWYPRPEKWAKAYEMMSCFEGIIELYRYTGEEKYISAAEKFYDILINYELNPLFSVAYNDMFADAADEINAISEPCDVIHFMRICYELYLLTGNVKYVDSFENTFFNAFLAGVFKDGKWGARGVRSAGRHFYAVSQAGLTHNHCCVNNMPRAFMTMARCAVMQKENDVVINLYENITTKLKNAEVTIYGSYFSNGEININIKFTAAPSDIYLRIPSWSKNAEITSGKKEYAAKPGYLRIENTEKEVSVKVKFFIKPIVHTFTKDVPQHKENDVKFTKWANSSSSSFTTEKAFLKKRRSVITYGPLLLARSKIIGNTEKEMFEPEYAVSDDAVCTAIPVPCDKVRIKLKLKSTGKNGTYETEACDFASAGNEKLDDPYYFSIYF